MTTAQGKDRSDIEHANGINETRADCRRGQQRVMRLGGKPLGSLACGRVLTNRMSELFTYGSVGGAGGNSGSYPAPNERPARAV